MNTYSKLLLFVFLSALFVGCTHGVFVQKDAKGTSKFTLFKDQFKYEENIGLGKLKVWGPYEIRDSVIVFEYDGNKKIPYNYNENNIEKVRKNEEECFSISIIDEVNGDPLCMANVAWFDEFDVLMGGGDANIEGESLICKVEKIQSFEISYIGYTTQNFSYDEYLNYDLIVHMVRFKAGSRESSSPCFDVFNEAVLEYEIDNPSDIKKFKRGDVLFEKKSG